MPLVVALWSSAAEIGDELAGGEGGSTTQPSGVAMISAVARRRQQRTGMGNLPGW
jgi:hypothetical protein